MHTYIHTKIRACMPQRDRDKKINEIQKQTSKFETCRICTMVIVKCLIIYVMTTSQILVKYVVCLSLRLSLFSSSLSFSFSHFYIFRARTHARTYATSAKAHIFLIRILVQMKQYSSQTKIRHTLS